MPADMSQDRLDALRQAFERLVGDRDSFGLRRSRRGKFLKGSAA